MTVGDFFSIMKSLPLLVDQRLCVLQHVSSQLSLPIEFVKMILYGEGTICNLPTTPLPIPHPDKKKILIIIYSLIY